MNWKSIRLHSIFVLMYYWTSALLYDTMGLENNLKHCWIECRMVYQRCKGRQAAGRPHGKGHPHSNTHHCALGSSGWTAGVVTRAYGCVAVRWEASPCDRPCACANNTYACPCVYSDNTCAMRKLLFFVAYVSCALCVLLVRTVRTLLIVRPRSAEISFSVRTFGKKKTKLFKPVSC